MVISKSLEKIHCRSLSHKNINRESRGSKHIPFSEPKVKSNAEALTLGPPNDYKIQDRHHYNRHIGVSGVG